MYPRTAFRSIIRILIVLVICAALLPLPSFSWLVSEAAQGPGSVDKGEPRREKPDGELPDLNDVENESSVERESPGPIHSTIRSQKNEGQPWDGRRVGDPETPRNLDQASTTGSTATDRKRTLRAHARRSPAPPPVPDNQFVQNFFTWALVRNPTTLETTYWHDQLRVGHGQGQSSLKLAAIEMSRTLFESAEYAARNRNAHWYVYDLYRLTSCVIPTRVVGPPGRIWWQLMEENTYGGDLKSQLSSQCC